jgi:tRNA/tmRNA/rRNA uracil-C5-methylase (TrmA/RlmC/RlmD family)
VPVSDSAAELDEGDLVEVTVGPPAHGGHCVARIGGPRGQVVFVRHALPGERVTVAVTERHRAYLRGDAIAIHEAAADRVSPPCPYAHPGGCGGCDLQHVADGAQLSWKAAVVREQLARPGGLSPAEIDALGVRVERLPIGMPSGSWRGPEDPAPAAGAAGTLGWRSRIRYAVDAAGRPGLLQHRSHQVVPVQRCRIAHPALQELDVTRRRWPGEDGVEVVASTGGDVSVVTGGGEVRGPAEVLELAAGRRWLVPVGGFWQVHPAAPDALVSAVLDLLEPAVGERAWDLYGGSGLFAAALAGRTGARVTLVESGAAEVAAARANLADLPGVEVLAARVDVALPRRRITGPVDVVVLDPPRTGAGARVVDGIVAAGPRAVAYVACDPAAMGRDVAAFRATGWRLAALRAFDCFPMTQHVECVALLAPAGR